MARGPLLPGLADFAARNQSRREHGDLVFNQIAETPPSFPPPLILRKPVVRSRVKNPTSMFLSSASGRLRRRAGSPRSILALPRVWSAGFPALRRGDSVSKTPPLILRNRSSDDGLKTHAPYCKAHFIYQLITTISVAAVAVTITISPAIVASVVSAVISSVVVATVFIGATVFSFTTDVVGQDSGCGST